jgi:hypothetical protein
MNKWGRRRGAWRNRQTEKRLVLVGRRTFPPGVRRITRPTYQKAFRDFVLSHKFAATRPNVPHASQRTEEPANR